MSGEMKNDELPEGWTEAPFSALTVDPLQREPGATERITYIDIGSVDRDTKKVTQPQTMVGAEAPSRARKVVKTGDVLVSTVRPNLNAVAMVDQQYDGQFASTGFDVLRSPVLDPRWVFYSVRTPAFVERMTELVQGALYPAVRSKDVRAFSIPIAPLAEQKRIADKLEAVLGRVDACRARLDRVPDLLQRFRQSVLAAATSGKLTADWREENTSVPDVVVSLSQSDNLRKQLVDAANATKGPTRFRFKPAALIELGNSTRGIDELFELPQTWAWASVGQLTWSVSDGPHFSPKYVDKENGVPFISGRNITDRGIDFDDAKYVSQSDHEEFCKRAKPLVGDVLLTKGGTTGIAAVVTEPLEFSIWVHVALLKVVNDLVSPSYLRMALSSPSAYAQSQALTHGVGNQDLGLTRLVHIALPLPPLPEQHEIVRRVETLFAFVDCIEARLTEARTRVERLTPATLAKAFRGELVPQDPKDEPASKLLERLKQEPIKATKRRKTPPSNSPRVRVSKEHAVMTKSRLDDDVKGQPYLASLLRASTKTLDAAELFKQAELSIVDFYKQLSWEVEHGFILHDDKTLEAVS